MLWIEVIYKYVFGRGRMVSFWLWAKMKKLDGWGMLRRGGGCKLARWVGWFVF